MVVSLYRIGGRSASAIAASIEEGSRAGRIPPGSPLPTVRSLAATLKVSPTTVSAAYRMLRTRGLVVARGRRGTRVSHRPPLATRAAAELPSHLRNLADGNPDPALLADLRPVLGRLAPRSRIYGGPTGRPGLLRLAARELEEDGIPTGSLAVVGGALDGIERVLQARLRPGDRVAVEDPGYSAVFDLLGALGLVPEPVTLPPAETAAGSAAFATLAKTRQTTARALSKVFRPIIRIFHLGPKCALERE
jgi:DNA-binding transcriptional MocR family regulator